MNVSQRDGYQFLDDIEEILSTPIIDLKRLRKFSQFGYPTSSYKVKTLEYRATCWKLLLGFLPVQRSLWPAQTHDHKVLYDQYVEEYLSKHFTEQEVSIWLTNDKIDDQCKKLALQTQINSSPDDYQANFQLWEQVEKDTQRTRTELNFFCRPVDGMVLRKIQYMTLITRERHMVPEQDFETHADVLSRILFIYGKLNTCIKYVQGMNELLSNIYLVYLEGPNAATAESDSFFSFIILMSQTHDNFIRSLDNATGINNKMRRMSELLLIVDIELWRHLDSLQIDPAFYGYRWILLYLSHEFQFRDILMIWDSIFSKSNQSQYLLCLCIAILQMLRDQLLTMSFNQALMLLQNFKIQNIAELIQNANSLECLHQS